MGERTKAGRTAFLEGGGEMGALMRAYDWRATPLGDPGAWPIPLKTALRLMLTSRDPMMVWWGDELITFYNDAHRQALGPEHHPAALGRPGAVAWPEVWPVIGPVLRQVMDGGEPAWGEERKLQLRRFGRVDDAYWTYGCSPLLDEDRETGVGGVLVVCHEVTARRQQIQAENARAASLLASIGEGFMILDRGFRVVQVNAEGARIAGMTEAEILGRSRWELWPETIDSPVGELYRRVMETKVHGAVQERYDYQGRDLWLDIHVYPLEAGLAAFYRDITATKEAEKALRESEARLRIAQTVGGIGAYELNPETGEIYASDVARRLWGVGPDTVVDRDLLLSLIHPDDREARQPGPGRTIQDLIGHAEYRILRADTGEERWLSRHVDVVRDEAGKTARIVGAFQDVTEAKLFEARQQLLINELNHRVKNTLATVQSIAAQTLRATATPDDVARAFEDRLLALSRAHNVLTRRNWEGAGLGEIVQEAIAPHRAENRERVTVEGPEVRLSPQMALALAMALQELATNAAKYGALSDGAGRVEIRWTMEGEDGERRLQLVWRERDGPPVSPPSRRGFGSRLIERGLAHEIGGQVKIDFDPAGVVCRIDARLD